MSKPGHSTPALQADTILETIADGVLAVDPDWCFTYVNREAERLLGQTRAELLGKSLWDEFPEDGETAPGPHLLRAVASSEPVHFETYNPMLKRWLEVRAYPSPTHLTVYLHDITDRRRTEDALRISRERLDLVLKSVDVGLWYCDLPFDKLVWNERTKEHFGLSPDAEVTIHTFFDRLHPEDRDNTQRAIQTAIANGTVFDTEYRTIAPDGRVKWIRAIGQPFYKSNGTPDRFDGVTIDTTPQKALLAQEQQSRAEAELLNRIGRAVSAELELQKLVQMITNAATEITGAQFGAFFYNVLDSRGESYTLYTLSGVPREMFERFPMPRNTAVFAPTFRGEGVVRSDDITKDPRYGKNPPYNGMPAGHLPVHSYLAVPVVSRSGQVIGGLFFGHEKAGVFTDTHERIVIAVASQAATAMDNAQLFTAAERSRREAQESAAALAKLNAELQQVAYVAAHDLQEPLRTIASFTQLVERRYKGLVSGEADELVDSIVGAVRRMQMLLNDVLEYTSLSSEDKKPADTVDLADLLRECLEELHPTLAERQAKVTVAPLPVIRPANRSQLRLLFLNLLDNALKYSRAEVQPEITITCRLETNVWKLEVQDNGQGFAPRYSKQIFGLFRRLHGREVPGTGIGLALCRRIVEMHGGEIWAESEPEHGTTIHFTLPCGALPE